MSSVFVDTWAWYALADAADADHTLAQLANEQLLDEGSGLFSSRRVEPHRPEESVLGCFLAQHRLFFAPAPPVYGGAAYSTCQLRTEQPRLIPRARHLSGAWHV